VGFLRNLMEFEVWFSILCILIWIIVLCIALYFIDEEEYNTDNEKNDDRIFHDFRW